MAPLGRSLIHFVANVASSLKLKFARSRKSLISANCRYCRAGIETELAIPLEPLAHVKSVQTQVVVRDRQNYEKSSWVAFLAGESIGSGTSAEGIVPSSTTKALLTQFLEYGNVHHLEFDSLLWPSTDGTVAIRLFFCQCI